MGNKKARELGKSLELQQAWVRPRSGERAASEDVHIPGIGSRRLQLIVLPSFTPARAWEVRQLDATWRLYRSTVIREVPNVMLSGYEEVPSASLGLADFFRRAVSLQLSLMPCLEPIAGADGTVTQLAVFGELCSEWRFQWWSRPPSAWQPLGELASEMVKAFGPSS